MAKGSVPTEILTFPDPETKVVLNYIFLDKGKSEIRDKVRIVDIEPKKPEDCPQWQETLVGEDAEYRLHPVALFKDPFRKGKNKIVLCEFRPFDDRITGKNTRAPCEKLLNSLLNEDIYFGFEQEFFITDHNGSPLGSDLNSVQKLNLRSQQGLSQTIGLERQLAETHLKACIYAGLNIAGMKRERSPGQWQYQIGPCSGIEAADQLIISRFILTRLAEYFGVEVSFKKKEEEVKIESSRLRINFSTKNMRQEGDGLKYIDEAIKKIKEINQEELISFYSLESGRDIGRFPTTTARGETNRPSAFRIPLQVIKKQGGHFQEGRPRSNADPYEAMAALTVAIFHLKFTLLIP